MTDEFAIKILEQYREKPTLINEIEMVEEAVWLDEALNMAIKAIKQKSVINEIFNIVFPLSIMSTDKLEHEAIMKIAEMLEPLHWLESEDKE